MAFHKVLIANRGEIAVRIIQTAHELGYQTAAVFSDADEQAPHVGLADEAVHLGGSAAADSYLNQAALMQAIQVSGADAVHPGYGFLSENPHFAATCEAAGLTFIGPASAAIRSMGSKRQAKQLMAAYEVPCIPGEPLGESSDIHQIAQSVGYPVMIKASAGGGGRGMRLVNEAAELAEAVQGARSEAKAAFGDDSLLLEKAVQHARHVEIQIAVDDTGHGVALGERDCSVQRRHQKVVEESPCPVLDGQLREEMQRAALRAASAVNYCGLGTVEFLLDGDGCYYFLEMNTRLQVEHPVTEMVTGLDLVALQFQIAAGESIADLKPQFQGHAVEVRLYAEDEHHIPHTGTILNWIPPSGIGVRVDHGLRTGNEVTAWYDPMLAKIITHGPDRATALRRLDRALRETVLMGVTHNRQALRKIINHADFQSGQFDTAFLERVEINAHTPHIETIALAACLFESRGCQTVNHNSLEKHILLNHGQKERVRLRSLDGNRFQMCIRDLEVILDLIDREDGRVVYQIDGLRRKAFFYHESARIHLQTDDGNYIFENGNLTPPTTLERNDSNGRAVMEGRVVRILVAEGETVEKGQTLVVLEAMKMEHQITADRNGEVIELLVKEGEQAAKGCLLFKIGEPPSI